MVVDVIYTTLLSLAHEQCSTELSVAFIVYYFVILSSRNDVNDPDQCQKISTLE